jgi:hypothetical protein
MRKTKINSTYKSKKNKKNKKGKKIGKTKKTNMLGGIFTKNNSPSVFNYNNYFDNFIKNSRLKVLSDSSLYSIIFTSDFLTNTRNIEPPYYSLRSQTFGQPINKIIVKLCAINLGKKERLNFEYKLQKYSEDEDEDDDIFVTNPGKESDQTLDIGLITKQMTSVTSFQTEVSAQIKTSLLTCNYLESLCPFPIYSKINNKYDSLQFLNLLSKANPNNRLDVKIIIDSFKSIISEGIIDGIGVIAMEIADGFMDLSQYYSDPNFELYKNMARYQLLQLAIDTGYTTGDYHMNNIMLNPNYSKLDIEIPSYFKDQTAFAMLIDFGWSTPINNEKLTLIKQQFASKDFKSALTTLLSVPRFDGLILRNNEDYLWIAQEETNGSINAALSILNEGRKEQIEKLIAYSKRVQSTPGNEYPELPISWKKYIDYMPRKYYISNEV